jgi:hypothetical protein
MTGKESAPASFAVRPQSLIWYVAFTAVAVEITLVLLDLLVNYARPDGHGSIRRLFNITREDALPSWFATTQTFLIALTLCVIWLVVRQRNLSAWSRRGWLAVALFFFYMAVDDGAKVHERIGSTLGDVFEDGSLVELFPSYGWQLFVMPLFAVAGLLLLLFLWRELTDRRARVLLLVALTCLTVAVGLDFIEGLDEEHSWNLHAQLDRWLAWDETTEAWFGKSGFAAVVHFSKSVEAFLEMLANTLLWVAFLRHLTGLCGELRLRFG